MTVKLAVDSLLSGTTFALDTAGGSFNVIGAALGHTDCQFLLTGSYTPGQPDMVAMAIETELKPQSGGNSYGLSVFPLIDVFSSGTHGNFASLVVQPLRHTAGAATVTNATSLWITGGAPTVGVNNRALWVDAGLSEFDGPVNVLNTLYASGTLTTASSLTANGHSSFGSGIVPNAGLVIYAKSGVASETVLRLLHTATTGTNIAANIEASGAGGTQNTAGYFYASGATTNYAVFVGAGRVNLNLPTSSAGLGTGDLWSNAGVVTVA